MSLLIEFTLNGKIVQGRQDETIWQVAQRYQINIPHLCHTNNPNYRPDGNCRACVVEIEGERVLAASCIRNPTPNMIIHSNSKRSKKAQSIVMELLLTDQPKRDVAYETNSHLWQWADKLQVSSSRFDKREVLSKTDNSHPAMQVALDACIQCNLCVRACREVQVNNVIGVAFRGSHTKIVFDQDDPMGESTCVACGECVQICPTGALMESSLINDQGIAKYTNPKSDLNETHSVCPYCGVGCQITYQTKDDQIISVQGREGFSNQGRLCVKGRFGFDYIKHPNRLTKPLIRLDKSTKFQNIESNLINPLTYFREASWEEALDIAGNTLKTIRDQEGSSALAGLGSAKCSSEEAYLFQKLVRTGFKNNNVDHCTRLCHASSVAALLEGIGSGSVSAPFNAVKDSDCIIVIGADPISNHPVAATFFKQAAKRAKLIVMDPRKGGLHQHATHMLQFNPGSDVAMLNAILNVIVTENLYNRKYVEQHTEGFAEFRNHIKNFTPEKMESICGIDSKILKTVARIYATAKASIIFWGMGISQHVHGTDNARCLIALSLITGQIGRSGTGLHPLRGQNNVQGASDVGLIPMMLPDYRLVNNYSYRKKFDDLWSTKINPNPGLTVIEMMHAIHNGEVKGMYIMGENPAMSDPDVKYARNALAKLDYLIVQDLFLTETAFYADVIFPASAWPEKDGTVTNTNRQVQMGRQAIKLPGDVRHDWWITQEIARRFDLNWEYNSPSDVFSEMGKVMPSLNNFTWKRLQSESSVTYPCDKIDKPGNDIVFSNGFPTASKKGKLVPANLRLPDEIPDEEYSMILTTGRQLEHWHTGSMTRRTDILDHIEPEAVAYLSHHTLMNININAGDQVRILTRRGMIEIIARLDPGIPDNMIFVPFCYAEAAANTLTNSALDPIAKIPEFKFCAAKIEPL